ncbi:MAG: hypothetical protein ACYDCK_12445 [Thermoplasmatota archaeon]
MASLDVLDYVTALEAALAPLLPRAERRLAIRETRHVIDELAFRLAWAAERRVPPEDIDYARAIECLKPAAAVAPILARRRPKYRKRVIRRQVTTIFVLLFMLVAGVAFAHFIASEKGRVALDWAPASGAVVDASDSRNFTIMPGASEVQFSFTADVAKVTNASQAGLVEITVLDPAGNIRYQGDFTHSTRIYDRANVESPPSGVWVVYVDFHEALAGVRVNVVEVTPAAV